MKKKKIDIIGDDLINFSHEHQTRYYIVAAALAMLITASCSKDAPIVDDYQSIADTVSVRNLSAEMAAVRDYVPQYANIAHRGTTYWAPEETESSWRWARHMGTDYLEADLQCSKDAVVLAVHDDSFLPAA